MNSQCDGDRDSYDAMILLTGRFDYHDVRPGLKIFFYFHSGQGLGVDDGILFWDGFKV